MMMNFQNLALYYRYSCFFCRRVMVELEEMQQSVELRSVDEYEHLSALLEGGGMQQVPALRITDAEGHQSWLYESRDIIQFLQDSLTPQTERLSQP